MTQKVIARFVRIAVVGLMSGCLFATWIAEGINVQAQQQDKPVEQTRKNIQVLKGLPDSQLFSVMNFMRGSLGVSCAYCHVYTESSNKWEWEKDDKPAKRTARRMIQMVFDINKANFNGAQPVTCYTCHRGAELPAAAPPLPQTPPEGGASGIKPVVSLPTVDQVLDKYLQALGGRASIEKAKTRVMKGEQISWDGKSAPIEIHQQSPNKFLLKLSLPQAVVMGGYNGTTAWMKTPRGLRELSGADLTQAKRNADFFRLFDLKKLSEKMKVSGKEKIGEREVYVVEAQLAPNMIEKWYFDTQTGLLLRDQLLTDTIIFWLPEQLDYDDYREVDGIKMPFTIRQSYVDPWVGWTRKFSEIKINAPVDESQFNMPQ